MYRLGVCMRTGVLVVTIATAVAVDCCCSSGGSSSGGSSSRGTSWNLAGEGVDRLLVVAGVVEGVIRE